MTENWLPVVGYEGLYEISDLGRVYSIPRPRTSGDILKFSKRGPYRGVQLWRNGKAVVKNVHQLVAEAFLGPCPPGQEVLHGSNGKKDDSAANLSYGTHAENCQDKIRDDTLVYGVRHYNAKLTEDDIIKIRLKYRHVGGMTYQALAAEYGVSWTNIRSIVRRQTWKQVP